MNFLYRNLTPRQIVALGLAVPLVCLFVIAWLQWQSVSDMLKTRQIVRQNRTVQLALGVFRYSLSDAESCQFRYILTKNPVNLDLYHKLLKDANDQIDMIHSLTSGNPLQVNYLAHLEPLLASKMKDMDASLTLEQNGNHAGALQTISAESNRVTMLDIETTVENMQVVETQTLLVGQNKYQHDFKLNAALSLAGMLLSLFFVCGIILLLRQLSHLQSMVTLSALTHMIEYEGGQIPIEEYLKRRHEALTAHGQAQIEAERLLGLLEKRKTNPASK